MVTFGGLNTMWLLVLFDLPTDTKQARQQYARFRKRLLEDGIQHDAVLCLYASLCQ